MVVFWHPDGPARDEAHFPGRVLLAYRQKERQGRSARVLIELREERGDKREWTAAGFPDPMEAGAGPHPLAQWVLRYRDLGRDSGKVSAARAENNGSRRTKTAAGSWRGIIDGEDLKRTLYEARRTGSRI